jgi:phosphatidylserine/phosphatidylglycerophosphate/cardiolipin synthase-like enzyme
MDSKLPVELLTSADLHDRVIQRELMCAEQTVWIATADLKNMHVPMATGKYRPILETFDRLAKLGVRFRIIHASQPSRPFQDELDRFERLVGGALELQVCPRSHWKMVVVDGRFAYLGSANFTGAGLGAKQPGRRNLELGVASDDPVFVRRLADEFDRFWIGERCHGCGRIDLCPDPIGQA